MPGPLPTSLRGRIVTAYAVGVMLAVCAGLLAGYLALVSLLRSAAAEEVTARLDDLAAAVQTGDALPVQRDPYAQLLSGNAVVSRSPVTPDTPVLTVAERAAVGSTTKILYRSAPGLPPDAMLAARRLTGDRVLVVGGSLTAVETAGRRILVGLLILAPVLIVLFTLVVRRLIDAALRPIASLTARAGVLSAATPGQRLPQPPGRDEVAELARTLNGMLDRVDDAAQRERAFLDDAAHELRTPVAILRGEIELGLTDPDPDAGARALRAALAEADRLTNLANNLLVLARARTDALDLDRQPTDVTAAVRHAARRAAFLGGASLGAASLGGAAIEVVGDELVADVDATRFDQAVTNLIANAAQAGAGRVRVEVRQSASGGVTVTVDDDGPGFPPVLLPVRFDRFNRANRFRRDSHPRGTGLGLSIVAAIVHAHGGTLCAGNDSGLGGARVWIELGGRPGGSPVG